MELEKNDTMWTKGFVYTVLQNLLLCLAHFSVNPYIVTYAKALGAGIALTGFLSGMFFGVALAIRPVSGPMITRLDKRKLLIAVFALGMIAQIGYAMFPNIPMFIVFRFINGAQYSFVGSLIMTRIGDFVPPDKMVSGMGWYGVGGAIGMSLGPWLGTRVLEIAQQHFGEIGGFRILFLYAALIMAIAIVPCFLSPPDKKKSAEDIAKIGKWYKNIITPKAIPIAIVAVFTIISYSLFNAYIIEFAKERGIPNADNFFIVLALGLLVSRPAMGKLADRFGIAKLIFPGYVLYAISFLLVGTSKSLGSLILAAIVAAIGYGATQPTTQAMVVRVVPPLKRGVATNTYYVGMDFGFFLGPLLGGFVIELMGNYGDMFMLGSVPVVISIIALVIVLPSTLRQIERGGE